jgi:hypothetical protein
VATKTGTYSVFFFFSTRNRIRGRLSNKVRTEILVAINAEVSDSGYMSCNSETFRDCLVTIAVVVDKRTGLRLYCCVKI